MIKPSRNVFQLGQKVTLEAEVQIEGTDTTQAGNPVTVTVLRHREGRAVDTVMVTAFEPPEGKRRFTVELGRFAPDIYTYKGVLHAGGSVYVSSGQFAVENYSPEMAVVEPDSASIARLARASGGRLTPLSPTGEQIKAGTTSEVVIRAYKLHHNLWIYILLIAFLSAEWALRRRKALA